jgi:hypothetical protein
VVRLGPGVVALLRFPFSDPSSAKLRPAVVLAHAGGLDWMLCQVTSNPYGDPAAVALTRSSFAKKNGGPESGQLREAREALHGQRGHRGPCCGNPQAGCAP